MTQTVKYLDIAEFRRLGYLQELNRRFLHPCGLALSVNVAEDGTETLGGIWDCRDDPEGIAYATGMIDHSMIVSVDEEIARHVDARVALLGNVVQPAE